MKNKGIKIALLTIASMMFMTSTALVVNAFASNKEAIAVNADDGDSSSEEISSETSETEEVYECSVVIAPTEHGSITVDVMQGHIGDAVTVSAKGDFLYLVDSVSVNDIALVESETVSGEFTFHLVEGENVIKSSFVVDEETLGIFSKMYDEAQNKDWTSLFSVENIIVIIKWVLDGGVLLVMVRYFIKDKRLEKKVESKIQNTIEKIIPEATKNTVVASVETCVKPIFTELGAEITELMKGMSVMSKCMALMQEDTPEAKMAILDELSNLKIGDINTIEDAKKYIEDLVARSEKAYKETMEALDNIKKTNEQIASEPIEVKAVEEKKEEKLAVEENKYDGTQI